MLCKWGKMKQDKKVIVLMATYNGAAFLREQLDSIINQSYKNVEILVRDDGSTDETIEILREYENNHLIKVVYGENIGVNKGFFWLIENAGEADYYSFADQDDIWLPNKIARAVECLEKGDNNLPQVYFSNFDFCDSQMNYISTSPTLSKPQSLVRVLVGSQLGVGFTIVFNAAIKELINDATPFDLKIYGHDHWVTLMGLTFGTIVYDPTVTAKHRRHKQNVSNYKINFFELQKERIKDFIINNEQKIIIYSLYHFFQLYKDKMKEEDRRKFELFSNRKYSFKKAIKKSFFPERYRDRLFDEISIRVLFAIGKM
jgi:glycosyltransferase involved in cell wall biosynthesis